MLINREMQFEASAEVTRDGNELDLVEVPTNLRWEWGDNFSDKRTTEYHLDAAGGYKATLFVVDRQYSGYGWPAQMDDDPADILNQLIVAAGGKPDPPLYEEDPRVQPRLFPE